MKWLGRAKNYDLTPGLASNTPPTAATIWHLKGTQGGGFPSFHSNCKTADMVDVVNRRCFCQRGVPSFGLKDGLPTHCAQCKTEAMEDVTHAKCLNGCGTIVQNRNKGYCVRCFVFLFPDEKVSRNYKIKEKHFVDYIKAADILPDTPQVTFDKRLQGGCSARRPDIFVDVYTHTVHSECDENQHSVGSYSCDNKRLMELFQDAGNRPQVQLRFNPDSFTSASGVKHPSCFKYNKTGLPVIRNQAKWEARMKVYLERLTYHLTHVPDWEVTVEHLFYDGFDYHAEDMSGKAGRKRKRT
ncbi:hypothetical protein KFL_006580100 [Klebsormidium nitens]|uniref:Uncharacterized protein n=1 Tax=Klebsormidium nitens TaxID=105231 RepID=A0A1Y1IN44_KLENI|nr:hypothetical protein KFL_006580100 [Klebsormidium nitens]|eukprot:GAQ90581.1 hypothetical protein KFL_006580100 [Klebsormidium nitens]